MMLCGVVDMKNKNALVALAYLSKNKDNPYYVFCNHIKYCMAKNSDRIIRHDLLLEAVKREFGIVFPQNVMAHCIALLRKEGFLKTADYGAGYEQIDSYDTTAFDAIRQDFKKKEDQLIKDLVEYSEEFRLGWDRESARNKLTDFLHSKGNAYDIFLNGDKPLQVPSAVIQEKDPCEDENEANDEKCQQFISEEWYIGSCINRLLASDSLSKQYLEDVVGGLMVCIGAYQMVGDGTKGSNININKTEFYFDTKLLLRFLGCAWQAAVESTNELVKLIKDSGGKIFYFEHTLQEVENALERAAESLERGRYIKDYEMNYFVQANELTPEILRLKKRSVRAELEEDKIFLRYLRDWNDEEKRKFNLDWEDLRRHIQKKAANWDATVENDIKSINEINILRKGDYKAYYGTKARLPVFVTSNTTLVSIISLYRQEREGILTSLNGWTAQKMPVISDIKLTCRLWMPQVHNSRLPTMQLAANAMAAQSPSPRFLAKLRQEIPKISQFAPGYEDIPISEFFADQAFVTELVKVTDGKLDEINGEALASSLEEYANLKAQKVQNENVNLINKMNSQNAKLAAQQDLIIQAAVDRLKDKFGTWRLALLLVKHWGVVISIIVAACTAVISICFENLYPLLLVLIPGVFAFLEEVLKKDIFKNKLLKVILPHITKMYTKRVKQKISVAEQPFESEILSRCLQQMEEFGASNLLRSLPTSSFQNIT